MHHLRLNMKIRLKTSFHITGNRWRWGVDRAATTAADGQFTIPATALKGLLRDNAGTILRSWNLRACLGPAPRDLCRDSQDLCLVCRVFGHPRRIAPIRFADALPLGQANSRVRNNVGISRKRRAALHQRLFFTEEVENPAEWGATAEGYFATEGEACVATALVCLAARFAHTLGADRSRGLGWLQAWEVQAFLDGQPLPEARLQPLWEAWRGGREA